MERIDVLIPTLDRPTALTLTLVSLVFQEYRAFSVIIADQSGSNSLAMHSGIAPAIRLLEHKGNTVSIHDRPVRLGMAEQREFLRTRSTARRLLYLDDDVILEPFALRLMDQVLERQSCGFAGMPLIGLRFIHDHRPQEERFEPWNGDVSPESITPHTPAWNRHLFHNAANMLHVQNRLQASPERPIPYKIAWIGGCVLYDAEKLDACGGFSFYRQLPQNHCGEDVLAQLRVMKRYGGCGILPSGAYHQEVPTTITDRSVNAPEILPV